MRINTTDANGVSGFYAVDFEVFAQTLAESQITVSHEMGGGVVIHHGTRDSAPIWLLDNALGELHGVWVEENEPAH